MDMTNLEDVSYFASLRHLHIGHSAWIVLAASFFFNIEGGTAFNIKPSLHSTYQRVTNRMLGRCVRHVRTPAMGTLSVTRIRVSRGALGLGGFGLCFKASVLSLFCTAGSSYQSFKLIRCNDFLLPPSLVHQT